MAVKPFLQGGTILGVVGYCSPRIIETAGEPLTDQSDTPDGRGGEVRETLGFGEEHPGRLTRGNLSAPHVRGYLRAWRINLHRRCGMIWLRFYRTISLSGDTFAEYRYTNLHAVEQ